MDKKELYKRVMDLFSHGINGQYKNLEYAQEVIEAFIDEVSKVSGFTHEQLCKSTQVSLLEELFKSTPADEIEEEIPVQKYTKRNKLPEMTIEDMDVYLEEDLPNKWIAEKLGVHVNTVSRRRDKLGLKKFSRK